MNFLLSQQLKLQKQYNSQSVFLDVAKAANACFVDEVLEWFVFDDHAKNIQNFYVFHQNQHIFSFDPAKVARRVARAAHLLISRGPI